MTQVLKPCPRQGRRGRLCKASEGVEEERRRGRIGLHGRWRKGLNGGKQAEPHWKPTQDAEDPEYQEGADHEEAPRRVQDTVADPG